MNLEGQQQRGRKQHELALRDGQTCIECHKGVAHKKPDGMTEEDAGA
jgi:cytochrome c-type protein NapC